MKWNEEDEEKLRLIKKTLIETPVLSLPDLERPFYLFVNVSNQSAYGVLTQEWAGIKKPVGYCSKLLDPVSRGWPVCLQAIVATALLIEEASVLVSVRTELIFFLVAGGMLCFGLG